MARAWEPDFIRLWQAGASQTAMAQALGLPVGTVKSRAHTLQQQGTIPPRPRGGLVPGPRPVQKPVQAIDTGAEYSVDTDAEQRTDTGAVSRVDTGAGHGLDTGAVLRLDHLEEQVVALTTLVKALAERMPATPEATPVQITTLPPYPKGKAVRWNLWILDAIREEIATVATQRGISPSQLVQEWLWKALSERRSSTP